MVQIISYKRRFLESCFCNYQLHLDMQGHGVEKNLMHKSIYFLTINEFSLGQD
jgi:hypothetical protein